MLPFEIFEILETAAVFCDFGTSSILDFEITRHEKKECTRTKEMQAKKQKRKHEYNFCTDGQSSQPWYRER